MAEGESKTNNRTCLTQHIFAAYTELQLHVYVDNRIRSLNHQTFLDSILIVWLCLTQVRWVVSVASSLF